MELENLLIDYVETTKEIIDILNRDEYDKLNGLVIKRQNIIDNIKDKNYKKEEIKEISSKLLLQKYEDEMNALLNKKYLYLKHSILSIKNQRKLSESYNKQFYSPVLFSKKV